MKAAQWREQQVMSWLEETLQEEVIGLAKQLGWMYYHTYNSRRSVSGFPDLVLVRAGPGRPGVLFRELKRTGKSPTVNQNQWLDELSMSGCDAGVWRPADWLSGRIQKELNG